MKNESRKFSISNSLRLTAVLGVFVALTVILWQPLNSSDAAGTQADPISKMYKRPAPDFDLNESVDLPNAGLRRANSSGPRCFEDRDERNRHDIAVEHLRRFAGCHL
jgi:hypothetical protein